MPCLPNDKKKNIKKIIEFLRIQVYMVNLDIADDLRQWF